MIKELWDYCQSDDFYKGKTTILITTDHGRGTEPLETWQHHNNTIDDCDQVWMAGLGSQIKALGESKEDHQLYSNQIAATVGKLLDINTEGVKMGAPMDVVLK